MYLSFDLETSLAALNLDLKKMLTCPMRGNLCCTTLQEKIFAYIKMYCVMQLQSVIIATESDYVYVKDYERLIFFSTS